MSQVIRPQIPYRGPVHGGFHDGKRIEIKGRVPHGADLFQVNLLTGMDSRSDRALHISVRFKGRIVVRNALQQNSYGTEERSGSFPFKHGGDFTMMISVNQAAYRIDVNGQNCWLFSHRIPFTRVSSIFIDGDVQIERIQFINKITSGIAAGISPGMSPGFTSGMTSGMISPGMISPGISPGFIPGISPGFTPGITPRITPPCVFPIYGGLRPSLCIHITAQPTPSPHNFTISLQNGGTPKPPDIALHMDARFYNHSIIRNSRNGNIWGVEEPHTIMFPFFPGNSFILQIRVHPDRYEVLVNQQHSFAFYHRLHNLSHFNTLYIENLIITSIGYQ